MSRYQKGLLHPSSPRRDFTVRSRSTTNPCQIVLGSTENPRPSRLQPPQARGAPSLPLVFLIDRIERSRWRKDFRAVCTTRQAERFMAGPITIKINARFNQRAETSRPGSENMFGSTCPGRRSSIVLPVRRYLRRKITRNVSLSGSRRSLREYSTSTVTRERAHVIPSWLVCSTCATKPPPLFAFRFPFATRGRLNKLPFIPAF